jgi:glutamate racemase
VLGCTHFPPFAGLLRSLLPPACVIVDSAATTALAVAERLRDQPRRTRPAPPRLLATDGLERFARVGSGFIGTPLDAARIERVDLA